MAENRKQSSRRFVPEIPEDLNERPGVFIGVDYGDSRTGIAYCPEGTRLSVPFTVIDSTRGRKKTAADVCALVKELGAKACVIGYPLNMDGSSGPRIVRTEIFARELDGLFKAEGISCALIFQDERLTSKSAEEDMIYMDVSSRRKGILDQIAAAIILQSYIDCIN